MRPIEKKGRGRAELGGISAVFRPWGVCSDATGHLWSCAAGLASEMGGALDEQSNWRLHKRGWELNAQIQVGIVTSKEKEGGVWLDPGIPVRAATPPDQRVLVVVVQGMGAGVSVKAGQTWSEGLIRGYISS